ncbi:MAG: hypothetical protein ACR2PS_10440, partial [Pseudomonadales bacterium]
MAQQFKEQGGAATMDPHPMLRWLTSKIATRLSRPERLEKQRARVEKQRVKTDQPHSVEYFHQIDDGYSHLAAQVLKPLAERYDIELVCHLVSGPLGKNSAEPELLLKLSRYDSFQVAPHYGLEFPNHSEELQPALVKLASGILAAQDSNGFVAIAAEVGRALWANDEAGLQALADRLGCASDEEVQARIEAGNARRAELKHYSGA